MSACTFLFLSQRNTLCVPFYNKNDNAWVIPSQLWLLSRFILLSVEISKLSYLVYTIDLYYTLHAEHKGNAHHQRVYTLLYGAVWCPVSDCIFRAHVMIARTQSSHKHNWCQQQPIISLLNKDIFFCIIYFGSKCKCNFS